MSATEQQTKPARIDIPSIEADIAFFEARLSLADHAPDTAYQRAQVKTYQTLGRLLGETLATLRAPRAAVGDSNAAA
ncbi:MAG: fumarate hydratase [Gammaproteobacteria bacterium]|nr:fumarate hydratase [Gammaproteobacteria bacterium]